MIASVEREGGWVSAAIRDATLAISQRWGAGKHVGQRWAGERGRDGGRGTGNGKGERHRGWEMQERGGGLGGRGGRVQLRATRLSAAQSFG